MKVPLELSIRDVEGADSDHIRKVVEAQVRKLEEIAPELIACRVAVEEPQRHQRTGSRYRVRVLATVPPHKEIVGVKEPGDADLHTPLDRVIRGAFDAVMRQMRDERSRRRGDVKVHDAAETHGIVVRVFPEAGYGFVKDLDDGHEVYFHNHAVLHDDFERLAVGTEVRYVETLGEEGPQASSIAVTAKPGQRVRDADQPEPAVAEWGEFRSGQ